MPGPTIALPSASYAVAETVIVDAEPAVGCNGDTLRRGDVDAADLAVVLIGEPEVAIGAFDHRTRSNGKDSPRRRRECDLWGVEARSWIRPILALENSVK